MIQKINIKEDFKIDKSATKYLWIIFALLFMDQLIKIIVFNTFALHEEIKIIGEWFRIQLELNDGTAFAYPFKNEFDRYFKIFVKLFLSFVIFLCLIYFINKGGVKTLLNGLAFCFAGLTGNLIDRIFHGVLLNNSLDIYSTKWFHGRVIDMFYTPLFEINMPNWLPIIGGENYLFFEPVFNFADLVLVVGAMMTVIGLAKFKIMQNK